MAQAKNPQATLPLLDLKSRLLLGSFLLHYYWIRLTASLQIGLRDFLMTFLANWPLNQLSIQVLILVEVASLVTVFKATMQVGSLTQQNFRWLLYLNLCRQYRFSCHLPYSGSTLLGLSFAFDFASIG